jgi:hypothetical protein
MAEVPKGVGFLQHWIGQQFEGPYLLVPLPLFHNMPQRTDNGAASLKKRRKRRALAAANAVQLVMVGPQTPTYYYPTCLDDPGAVATYRVIGGSNRRFRTPLTGLLVAPFSKEAGQNPKTLEQVACCAVTCQLCCGACSWGWFRKLLKHGGVLLLLFLMLLLVFLPSLGDRCAGEIRA